MGDRDRILMCPPDHFDLQYVINPWMVSDSSELSKDKAMQQWQTLKEVIGRYAEVVEISPQPDLPDMVFTANAGVVFRDKVIASHFIPHERRGEEAHFKKWFEDNGFELCALPDHVGFEGAGDCLADRGNGWLWTGYGFRTEIEAHKYINEYFDLELVPLKLTEPRFYHIDTCFCPLKDGYLLYHPPAFDYESRLEIERRIPSHKRIVIDTLVASNFACNAVNIGYVVILHKASATLKGRLLSIGFDVVETDVSEFLKAGGSVKCLTLKLTEPPVS